MSIASGIPTLNHKVPQREFNNFISEPGMGDLVVENGREVGVGELPTRIGLNEGGFPHSLVAEEHNFEVEIRFRLHNY